MKTASGRARYGFDAPGVMKGLLAAGLGGVVIGGLMAGFSAGWLQVAALALVVISEVSLLLGGSMGVLRGDRQTPDARSHAVPDRLAR
jgi:hypothetical protein